MGNPRTWRLSRRHLLVTGLAVGGATALPAPQDAVRARSLQAYVDGSDHDPLGRTMGAYPTEIHHAFMHGVASGDPLPGTVILWTRVTPSPQAVPGSGRGADTTLRWDVASDEDFMNIVRSGEVVATSATDHTVHVDPHELKPATTYYYRFEVIDGPMAGQVSPAGRARTAPADNADLESVQMAVCSCANYESGYFRAYGDIAERAQAGEIDLVVHLGDYIYEYASGDNPGKSGVTRAFEPTWELESIGDYRARYGHYRRDPELQAAHAAATWVVTWDDHEFADNWNAHDAKQHTLFQGPWEKRRDGAMRAYFDWLPVRGEAPADGGRLYRSLRFGTLAELHMLDLRSYRSGPGLRPVAGEGQHTIMGQEQFAWLSRKLSTTDARWALIGNSVMFSPVNLVGLDPKVRPVIAPLLGGDVVAELGPHMNPDQWDGYPADRERLLDQLADERPDASTIFLTGDIHSEWAGVINHRGRVLGAELVTTSVSATNMDDRMGLARGNLVSRLAVQHLLGRNPHFRHINLDDHGYMLVKVTKDEVTARFLRVDDVEAPGAAIHEGYALRFADGRLEEL